ncbi:hypothetical protein Mboo_0177 [Methanoregula boonei 6A8]|uniref:Uncharacterized protein n=1 Tax=Methanoregula boonei (strain DSM 21154 / JCM 14090 / 6A8) TaxID=456442 RepID=A7I4N9_METB6|nr:hypothetical protein [Methanoregula boonei]ABS54700.1 hypothetical protein Mboo_0177 [Methanoregula boonei 6A8]
MDSSKKHSLDEIQDPIVTVINEALKKYPHLEKIIPQCTPRSKLHFDQFKGEIPKSRKHEISESKIYEVLLGSGESKQFSCQLSFLESLLTKYPEYCTKSFGQQLVGAFFSHYLEIEIYDNLRECGYDPLIDPDIIPNLKNSTKADFKINQSGHDIFIEVVSPRLPLDEELMFEEKPKMRFFEDSERNDTFNKIYKEYSHHFKPFEPRYNSPTLIILDKTYSMGLSEVLGSLDLSRIYSEYEFPDYFIGILDRTRYNRDLIYKVLKRPRPTRFYLNPEYVDYHTLIPELFRRFIHFTAISG